MGMYWRQIVFIYLRMGELVKPNMKNIQAFKINTLFILMNVHKLQNFKTLAKFQA